MYDLQRYEIEKKAFDDFMAAFKGGAFPHQRLGQDFYNHFHLHKLTDQARLGNLYELDGEKAMSLIKSLFSFN